jgi:hypothetical protein
MAAITHNKFFFIARGFKVIIIGNNVLYLCGKDRKNFPNYQTRMLKIFRFPNIFGLSRSNSGFPSCLVALSSTAIGRGEDVWLTIK